jgi:molybdate transport system ATP-binding protein
MDERAAPAPQTEKTMNLTLRQIDLPLADFALKLDAELDSPMTVVFGPSGAGKTSLLDLIAGLRRPKSAFIALDGRVLTDTAKRVFVPAHERMTGYVPQDLALFPHLNVRRNILYGCRNGAAHPELNLDRVTGMLEIAHLLERDIDSLSGGEGQRVALARALVTAPRILLLDEPMASLDNALKERLIPYLLRIREEFRIPMIYVTHDRSEVAALSCEMVTLEHGGIVSRSKRDSGV